MKLVTSFAALLSAITLANGAYTPRALTKAHCEFLTDEECEIRDVNFADQVHQRRLVVESLGTLNLLVIPLKWSDTPSSRILPSVADLDELWNGVGVSDIIPSGSIANYTNVNSYGKLTLSATVVDWITADNTEIYYAAGRSGRPNLNEAGTVQLDEAIFIALEQLFQSGFDFLPFDQNFDGVLDAVAILHSGYSAEIGGTDCLTGRTSVDRIHSHYSNSAIDENAWVGPGGVRLGSFTVASAFSGLCDSNIAQIGTMTHEYIHLFGMPEMYDVGGPYSNTGCCVGGLGGYDIMASPYGQGNLLSWPGHLAPWNKLKLNWVTPVAIETDGTYTLRPSELYPDIYMISAPYPSGEYLLLEVRRPLLFDNNLWQPGGLLIYHIDDNAAGPGNQVRGFPGVSGWPGNGAHYVAALLQSDGAYGLEQAIDNGHLDDFWTAGKTLGPGNGEQVVDSANYPNTDSYSAGIQVTGLIITNFVDGDDGSVSFDVSGLAPSTGEGPSSTFPPGPSPTDGGTTDSGSGGGTGGGWPTLSPVDNSPTDGESTNEGEPAEDNGSPTDGTGSEGSSASTKSFSFVVGSFLALWSSFWIE